jgi:hypothetical protein
MPTGWPIWQWTKRPGWSRFSLTPRCPTGSTASAGIRTTTGPGVRDPSQVSGSRRNRAIPVCRAIRACRTCPASGRSSSARDVAPWRAPRSDRPASAASAASICAPAFIAIRSIPGPTSNAARRFRRASAPRTRPTRARSSPRDFRWNAKPAPPPPRAPVRRSTTCSSFREGRPSAPQPNRGDKPAGSAAFSAIREPVAEVFRGAHLRPVHGACRNPGIL